VPNRYIRGIGLDLDNTLADSAPAMAKATNETLSVSGHAEFRVSVEDILSSGPLRLLSRAGLGRAGRAQYWRAYRERLLSEVGLFRGFQELFSELPTDIPVAVLTSSPKGLAEDFLSRVGLRSRLSGILGYGDVVLQRPHPEGILSLAKLCGIPPVDVVYMGDKPEDIDAAHAAKAVSATGRWSRGDRAATLGRKPKFVLDNPEQLRQLLNGSQGR
jgi:phosphoglycolate phosphatase-like HAD superfamily hydrolase